MSERRQPGDGRRPSGPGVFGHRGGNIGPQNSVEAIRMAAEAGADGVEIDIQIGPDGSPIAGHDLVDRGSNADPDQGHAGAGDQRPTSLRDVLAAVTQAEISLLIDFKSAGEPEREAAILASALAGAARPDLILISSFSVPFLDRFQPLAPRFPLYPIVSFRKNFLPPLDLDRWAGASVLATALLANPLLLAGLRRKDRRLFVWFAVTEWPALIKLVSRLGAHGVIVSKLARTVAMVR